MRRGLFVVNEYRRGRLWCAGFETYAPHVDTPEKSARSFLRALDALTARERALLRSCSLRTLDVAFDVGDDCDRFTDGLSAETTLRLGQHGVGVRLTLYTAAEIEPDA